MAMTQHPLFDPFVEVTLGALLMAMFLVGGEPTHAGRVWAAWLAAGGWLACVLGLWAGWMAFGPRGG